MEKKIEERQKVRGVDENVSKSKIETMEEEEFESFPSISRSSKDSEFEEEGKTKPELEFPAAL